MNIGIDDVCAQNLAIGQLSYRDIFPEAALLSCNLQPALTQAILLQLFWAQLCECDKADVKLLSHVAEGCLIDMHYDTV